jgi:hypothetical protein
MKWLPDDETREAWATAAGDALIDPSLVHLYVAASTDDEYGAMHYPPGTWALPHDDTFDYSDGLRERLYELQDEHVIVIAKGQAADLRLLVLRHEAEHVGQDLFNPAIGHVGLRLTALWGDAYYGALPHERDADAAATAMRESRQLQASAEDLTGPNRKLYSAEWPPADRASLPVRLLAQSLFHPTNFNTACRSSSTWPSVDPDELLEELLPGAARVRAAVKNRYVQRALDAVAYDYDEHEWPKLPTHERDAILDKLRGQLVDEEVRVINEIHPILES